MLGHYLRRQARGQEVIYASDIFVVLEISLAKQDASIASCLSHASSSRDAIWGRLTNRASAAGRPLPPTSVTCVA
jgi:hypothetical protein